MKIRYSERVLTEFPVIFAGDSFVGEGTVHNVSVPGCADCEQPEGRTGDLPRDESPDAGQRPLALRRTGKDPLAERTSLWRRIHSDAGR